MKIFSSLTNRIFLASAVLTVARQDDCLVCRPIKEISKTRV